MPKPSNVLYSADYNNWICMNVLSVSKLSVIDTDFQPVLNPIQIDKGITGVSY